MTGSIADRFFNYDGPRVREGAGVVRFLADRPDSDWATLVERTETRRYNVGHTIIAAGERDQALYLLTEGVVGVVLPGSQGTFKEMRLRRRYLARWHSPTRGHAAPSVSSH